MKHAGEYRWSASLDVDCPHCLYIFDANDDSDFVDGCHKVFDSCKDVEIRCPKCRQEFTFNIGAGT